MGEAGGGDGRTNRFGLPRAIPEGVQREVRQRCGFGCIVCGCSIYEYEHIDPQFKDAKQHDPAAMALLCPTHHGYVTRGIWSKETVQRALQNPHCKQLGFSFGELDPARTPPAIVLGGSLYVRVSIPLLVEGVPLIAIEQPDTPGEPYRVSAMFCDDQGRRTLMVLQNEWRASTTQWDVEVKGAGITIRSGPGQIALRLRFVPQQGIVVERVSMRLGNFKFDGDEHHLRYSCLRGGGGTISQVVVEDASYGIRLENGGVVLG